MLEGKQFRASAEEIRYVIMNMSTLKESAIFERNILHEKENEGPQGTRGGYGVKEERAVVWMRMI